MLTYIYPRPFDFCVVLDHLHIELFFFGPPKVVSDVMVFFFFFFGRATHADWEKSI